MPEHKLAYAVRDTRINDSWYAFDGDTVHAFYLQYPAHGDLESCWCCQTVGHSVCSIRDLTSWTDCGTVLAPLAGTWNDKGIATGSTVRHDGKWYMIYTGNSHSGEGGFGMAVSEDLMHWEKLLDRPVIDRSRPVTAAYMGRTCTCRLLADPYIYPEALGGYYFMYVNAYIEELPLNRRGGQVILRSRDLFSWEACGIAMTGWCDRAETAQVWVHKGRWYMVFGAVTVRETPEGLVDDSHSNEVYTADSFTGPFLPLGQHTLAPHPDDAYYILKVFPDAEGRDVALLNVCPDCVIGPFAVAYPPDGGLCLDFEQ